MRKTLGPRRAWRPSARGGRRGQRRAVGRGGSPPARTLAVAVGLHLVALILMWMRRSNPNLRVDFDAASNSGRGGGDVAPLSAVVSRAEYLDLSDRAVASRRGGTVAPGRGASGTGAGGGEDRPASAGPGTADAAADGSGDRYAYAWLLGGVDGTTRAHEGLLWGTLVAMRSLRDRGSTADFVVYAQLAPGGDGDGDGTAFPPSLPPADARALGRMGARTLVLETPAPHAHTFAGLVYEKFRPLQLTEYRRVIFLDADVLPLVNLDYLFRLTEGERPVLRSNFFFATRGEPCNTGFFMLSPEEGAYEDLRGIIARQHEEGSRIPYPHFDFKRGWGHDFVLEGDVWEAVVKNGDRWRFHAGWSDQGLWYYYVKYHRQDGSIAIGSRLQTITPGKSGRPDLDDEEGVLARHDPRPPIDPADCKTTGPGGNFACNPGYRGFVHFAGEKKPWLKAPPREGGAGTPHGLWHETLADVNRDLGMGLDLADYRSAVLPRLGHSPLGYVAQHSDHARMVVGGDPSAPRGEGGRGGSGGVAVASPTTEGGGDVPLLESTTVAYAISVVKCGNFQTDAAGLMDASMILRHSVHKISRRDPTSGSKYDYKMYAIVHRQAETCSGALGEVGFEVIVVDPPVDSGDIRGSYLRKNIHKEWCCGADEFIKLFAYTLPAEIIVHVDVDFAFYKPMDALFDAIRFEMDSEEGQMARGQLLLERPDEVLPNKIDAFITRDWPQVAPNKFPPGYQAGFLVARRDPSVILDLKDIILEGNYTEGWGLGCGWGNMGYGGYVGAMAMQGLLAYYYDIIRPGTAVELNQCRFNHMGMDVLYRKHQNFRPNLPGVGGCRNQASSCEDCMITPMEDIYSVHYTMCRKPWQCQATGEPGGRAPGQARASAINTDTVHLDHCFELIKRWHHLRADFEGKLYDLTNDESIKAEGASGSYRRDIFLGHCNGDGNKHYLPLAGSKDSTKRSSELYE